jgi:cytidine deaminase
MAPTHPIDDLGYLPSDPGGQDFLLRLLCHLVWVNGRVGRNQAAFLETLAEKMGRTDWEFPEQPQKLATKEIAGVQTRWRGDDQKLWLMTLVRRLALADGVLDEDEQSFISDLTSLLFSTSNPRRYYASRERLDARERTLMDAAERAASISDTRFWHRKSGKVVGAAIGVGEADAFRVFTGVNFELSQPTGSRCAEQIALGAALVACAGQLRYEDVRMVAVVAGQEVERPVPNPLPPCGVCCEMLHKINEDGRQVRLYMLPQGDAAHVIRMPFADYYPPRMG